MSAGSGRGLDYLRDFFNHTNADIIDIMENAILIAANDQPNELSKNRDKITRMLLSPCSESNQDVELLHVPAVEEDESRDSKKMCANSKQEEERCSTEMVLFDRLSSEEKGKRKKIKIKIKFLKKGNDEDNHDNEKNVKVVVGAPLKMKSNNSVEDLRIIQVLLSNHESDVLVLEELKNLHSMHLSFQTVEETKIFTAVESLTKHKSREICLLAKQLIQEWMDTYFHNSGTTENFKTNVMDSSEDSSIKAKLEISKRKLKQGYQQAEKVKRQKMVKMIDLWDIPKNGSNQNKMQKQPMALKKPTKRNNLFNRQS